MPATTNAALADSLRLLIEDEVREGRLATASDRERYPTRVRQRRKAGARGQAGGTAAHGMENMAEDLAA